jgi:hypothetical protein
MAYLNSSNSAVKMCVEKYGLLPAPSQLALELDIMHEPVDMGVHGSPGWPREPPRASPSDRRRRGVDMPDHVTMPPAPAPAPPTPPPPPPTSRRLESARYFSKLVEL